MIATDVERVAESLIGIESTPEVGSAPLAHSLIEIAQRLGLKSALTEYRWQGRFEANVLIGSDEALKNPVFALQSHLDTTSPGPYRKWIHTDQNPFLAKVVDGNLHGLGAADSKGDLASKLCALSSVDPDIRKKSVILATFAGAQPTFSGSRFAVQELKSHLKFVLSGAPTGLKVANTSLGASIVEFIFKRNTQEIDDWISHQQEESTATHSKYFKGTSVGLGSGLSAVEKIFQFLQQLPEAISILQLEAGLTDSEVLMGIPISDFQNSLITGPTEGFLEFEIVSGGASALQKNLLQFWNVFQQLKRRELDGMECRRIQSNEEEIRIQVSQIRRDHQPIAIDQLIEKLQRDSVCRVQVIAHNEPWMTRRLTGFSRLVQSQLKETLVDGIGYDTEVEALPSEAVIFFKNGIECLPIGVGQGYKKKTQGEESVGVGELEAGVRFYSSVLERWNHEFSHSKC